MKDVVCFQLAHRVHRTGDKILYFYAVQVDIRRMKSIFVKL
jgi:hypothetical protein